MFITYQGHKTEPEARHLTTKIIVESTRTRITPIRGWTDDGFPLIDPRDLLDDRTKVVPVTEEW